MNITFKNNFFSSQQVQKSADKNVRRPRASAMLKSECGLIFTSLTNVGFVLNIDIFTEKKVLSVG